MCKPVIVFLLLALNAASFFILCIFEKIYHDVSLETIDYINNIGFWLLWLLAVWSLLVMVMSQPGFIPNDYRYK
jgi:hypothetical protein